MENNTTYKFTIETAGKTVFVSANYEQTRKYCEKYIVPDVERPDIIAELTQDEIDRIMVDAREELAKQGIESSGLTREYYEFLLLHEKVSEKMPDFDIVMFHCSCIKVDDQAILFTAKSGTGKSTHSKNWKKYLGERMTYINDDKPFVGVSEAGSASDAAAAAGANAATSAGANATTSAGVQITAYGSPWNGKHFLGENTSAPIKAIGIIKRDTVNHIERVSPIDAFITLYQQIYLPRVEKTRAKTMQIMQLLAENVPVYIIYCNMEPESAQVAYEGIFGANK